MIAVDGGKFAHVSAHLTFNCRLQCTIAPSGRSHGKRTHFIVRQYQLVDADRCFNNHGVHVAETIFVFQCLHQHQIEQVIHILRGTYVTETQRFTETHIGKRTLPQWERHLVPHAGIADRLHRTNRKAHLFEDSALTSGRAGDTFNLIFNSWIGNRRHQLLNFFPQRRNDGRSERRAVEDRIQYVKAVGHLRRAFPLGRGGFQRADCTQQERERICNRAQRSFNVLIHRAISASFQLNDRSVNQNITQHANGLVVIDREHIAQQRAGDKAVELCFGCGVFGAHVVGVLDQCVEVFIQQRVGELHIVAAMLGADCAQVVECLLQPIRFNSTREVRIQVENVASLRLRTVAIITQHFVRARQLRILVLGVVFVAAKWAQQSQSPHVEVEDGIQQREHALEIVVIRAFDGYV